MKKMERNQMKKKEMMSLISKIPISFKKSQMMPTSSISTAKSFS